MNRTKNAIRNIVWGIVNRIIVMLLPFLNRTILIYILGTEYLGLDSLFSSILQMVNIAELGFGSAIVYNMYKPIAEHDNKKICALLNLYRKVYRYIGGIVLVIGILIVPVLPYLVKSELPKEINLYILYFIFLGNTVLGYWLFAYKKSIILANQREDISSKINTVVILIKTFLQVFFVYILKNYYIYILLMPITTIIENIIIAIITEKQFKEYTPKGELGKDTYLDIKRRVIGLMIQKVCSTSRNSLDNIIISAYIGLNAVAIYGNYYYIMNALHSLVASLTSSISAIVGNKIVKNSPEENHKEMLMFNFMYMWFASNITVVLLVLYQPFMKIWVGESMLLSDEVMIAMCVYFYTQCIGDVRSTYHVACGLWWEGKYRSVLETLSNLILNIILGRYFGIMGVVCATLVSLIVINFGYGTTIIYRYYFKGIGIIKFYIQHIYYIVVTVGAAVFSYYLCEKIVCTSLNKMILRGLLSLIVTNIILRIAYCKLDVYKQAYLFIKKNVINGFVR